MSMPVRLFDLLSGFSSALETLHPALAGHHARVAYLCLIMAKKLNMGKSRRTALLTAAMLHDIGTVPLKTETHDLIFEVDEGPHCIAGQVFCQAAGLPAAIADMVLHHHQAWDTTNTVNSPVEAGNLIHLADRADILLRTQTTDMASTVEALTQMSDEFAPHHLHAFRAASTDPELSAHIQQPEAMHASLRQAMDNILGPRQLLRFCNLFSLIIDAKSPFTATHSSGVAHTARSLFKLTGLADKCALHTVFLAGLLHDVGKLTVRPDILEKPAPLTSEEFDEIRRHAALSLELLGKVRGFTCIQHWGSLHHERLDGSGYPLGLTIKEISLPVRIIAVADVFTALTEDRPYRASMSPAQALQVMGKMVVEHKLDGDVVALLQAHLRSINRACQRGQRIAAANFSRMRVFCNPKHAGCPGATAA